MTILSIKFSGQRSLAQGIELPTTPQIPSKKFRPFQIKPSFNQIKKAWEYARSVMGVCKNIMSTLLQTEKWVSTKNDILFRKIIYRIGLINIVNLPINISYIPSKVQKIWDQINLKDNEGAVLAGLSFGLFMGNIFNTVTSFINTSIEALSLRRIRWISPMGLPLVVALIGVDIAIDTKNLYQLFKFRREFDREIIKKTQDQQCSPEELQGIITPFLEKNLGVNQTSNISLRKENVLERKTTTKVVAQFRELSNLIKENNDLSQDKEEEIYLHLKTIRKLLKTEERLNSISMVSSLVAGVAVSLFLHPPAAIVSHSLLTLASVVGLGLKINKDLAYN